MTTLDSPQAESGHTAGAAGLNDLELVLAAVRARLARRAAWLRHVWDKEGPSAGPFGITHAQADTALADADNPTAEAAWVANAPEARPLLAQLEAAQARLADATRLLTLATVLGLGPVELEVLQLCVAAAADPGVARVLAYLQDDATCPHVTAPLAARVVGTGRTLPLTADAPLYSWELVRRAPAAGQPDVLACDPLVIDWLIGDGAIDDALVGCAYPQPALPALQGWPTETTAALAAGFLRLDPPHAVRLTVEGVPGSGRRTFAAGVAALLDLPLLVVDTDATDTPWKDLVRRANRQAFLDTWALAWTGERATHERWPADVTPFPVQFLLVDPGASSLESPGAVDRRVELPLPAAAERRRLWELHHPPAARWPTEALEALARRRRATPGQIVRAARTAPPNAVAADDALRAASAPAVGGLVERMACPFEPDDLVVSEHVRATLDELAYEAEVRVALWEEPNARRLYPTGRGIVALFSGPPGTGKTMAAQVVARQLHADLLRVDLSTVVSKWVGETSENIDRILRQVSGADAVLLFDEADALYGKRASDVSDAQDRYVNLDTGHLMVAIERFDGVVLLATNQKSALDPAFLRRIRYMVDFPLPDADQRLEIWRRTMTGLVGRRPGKRLDAALTTVAQAVDLTGAQIKSGALSAVLAARRRGATPAIADVMVGVRRELAKVGQTLSERDIERIVRRGA